MTWAVCKTQHAALGGRNKKKDVVICHNPEEQEKYNILAVPTLIVFDNNVEIARYEANIIFMNFGFGNSNDEGVKTAF